MDLTTFASAAAWMSSITATSEGTPLSIVPVDIKSRILENSLSNVLHAHSARIVQFLARSAEVKSPIRDTHLMQMVRHCYVLGCNLSLYFS